MDKAHRLNYWLLAAILGLNLLLQGCSTIISNHDLSRDARGIRKVGQEQISIDQDLQDLKELIEQKLNSAGWEVVNFYNSKNGLKVKSIEKHGNFTSKPQVLSVNIAQEIDPAQISSLTLEERNSLIHTPGSKNGIPSCVLVSKLGILGGMKKGKEKDKIGEQEEEKKDKKEGEEAMVLDNSKVLPTKLLQRILAYVEYPCILACTRVNHAFYELITGYSKICLIGLEDKPNPSSYSNRWVIGVSR